jgi:crossover junction endodeoxyribonuclease RuvC
MRVLGIDCGTQFTGFAVVEQSEEDQLFALAWGAIHLRPRDPLSVRLLQVSRKLAELIARYQPAEVAVEDVFYSVNAKSALKLGQVRGVAMLAAAQAALPVAEYAPLTIKSAVVGYGRADKAQVQDMVTRMLRLKVVPEPADAADALAIAICHLHTAATLLRQGR